uniref:hypothetical protein n=1 Tax=Parerythrobacter lutipelagi TaxID=1964208 RepID=UPI0010F8A84F|nr:hypothetical protein [Parerythrobacter lutipelagi]
MTGQIGGTPDPRAGVPDIGGVDIDSLPRFAGDSLEEYYTPMMSGAWALNRLPFSVCAGYWSGLQQVYRMPLLTRRQNVWMSLSPMEIESQQIGVDAACGHVVIYGLGMGWAAAVSALRPEVERVTVVELDEDVIAMHEKLDLFARLPDGAGDKVTIVHSDALEWKPDGKVDLLMPDIWLDMVSWERAEEVREMQDNVGAEAVYFWGQELEIARHLAKDGTSIDDAGISGFARKFDLPLIGPGTQDYAARTRAAAKQWIKGRWLDGTDVPDDLRSEADDLQDD